MGNTLLITLMFVLIAVLAAAVVYMALSMGRMKDELSKSREDMRQVAGTIEAQKSTNESQDRAIHSLNAQMTEINKGIGQVTGVTESVASLNKVLTKVKTRGILGEYRAEAILREILADNQYEKNFDAAGRGEGAVEFVIRVPSESGGTEYLPLDSKFPLDTYQALVDAKEGADAREIRKAENALRRRLADEAADIKAKYIAPPRTTPYALMFLPVESLYFEVLDMGLFEELQRDYSVIAVGPTSLSAMLSSIETGYRAIALEAHSDEVWKTLSAVKTEFEKYYDALEKADKSLRAASNTIEEIIGPRTNVMMKKLDDVTELSEDEADEMFGFGGGANGPDISLYDDKEQ